MQDNRNFLGTEPIGKLLLKLSIPTVIAQLINMLYNIVDRIYIGHIPGEGSLALTGVGVCMPIIMIVSAFAALVSSGGAPRASIYMGKQDNDSAEQILGNCFSLQIVVSLFLTGILLIFGRKFFFLLAAYLRDQRSCQLSFSAVSQIQNTDDRKYYCTDKVYNQIFHGLHNTNIKIASQIPGLAVNDQRLNIYMDRNICAGRIQLHRVDGRYDPVFLHIHSKKPVHAEFKEFPHNTNSH